MQLIGGKSVDSLSGLRIDVVCPSDGKVFASIPASGEADVDRAVKAARHALEDGPWARMTAVERGRCLTRLGQLVEREAEALAALELRDTGKPFRQGRADVAATLRYFEFYGGAGDKVHGATIPFLDGYTALTLREPHGVVAGIIPWNYPLQILSRVAGAALAMGNTLVVKPAEDASLTAIRVAELALEAGVPAGVFNVVTGYWPRGRCGPVGPSRRRLRHLHRLAADRHRDRRRRRRATIAASPWSSAANRRSWSSPMPISTAALPVLVNAIIQNGGQTCSAGSRVLIERSIYERWRPRSPRASPARRRPARRRSRSRRADQHAGRRTRVAGMVAAAEEAGVPVLARGKVKAEAPAGGYYLAPVLFGAGRPDAAARPEEVFGPVLALFPFDDEERGVRARQRHRIRPGRRHLDQRRRAASTASPSGRAPARSIVNAYGAGGGIELPFGGFGAPAMAARRASRRFTTCRPPRRSSSTTAESSENDHEAGFKDKVAIVTGGASGFGEAMARRFAEEGAKVVVADLNAKGAERVAADIGSAAISRCTTDVTQRAEFDEMVGAAKSAFGRVDIMVNNAGYTHRNGDMLDVTEETFDLIAAVNMKAIYHAALAVVPVMERQGGGVIINTASTAGLRPRPGLTWYNASKGWAITATKSMAVELAPKKIRVNCLCPVAGETPMLEMFLGEDTPERRALFRASVPLGRLSTPLDIANAALYLASDEAEFITGVALEVDGGRCI